MLALAALLAFMGCASTPPAPTPPRVTGVTAYLWKVGASDASLAALREPVEDAPHSDPFGEGPAALWQANGVRVLGLPIDAATDLRMQATPSGALREYVIGESPAWAELIRSGRWTAPLLARLDAVEFGGGVRRTKEINAPERKIPPLRSPRRRWIR